jgi:glycosyltransferase involved in cell wall biosynthesis
VETPRQIIGRFIPSAANGNGNGKHDEDDGKSCPPLAFFCHDAADSYIGSHVANVVQRLVRQGRTVHLFCRTPFVLPEASQEATRGTLKIHAVGTPESDASNGNLLAQVDEYNRRAVNAFMQTFATGPTPGVICYEWTSAQALALLHGLKNQQGVLSLHSIEKQRSDLSNDTSRRIFEIEIEGVKAAHALLIHDSRTADALRMAYPACQERLLLAHEMFPINDYDVVLDAGTIKARYQIGPTDPVLLFVGDLSERYGPEAVLKAMPALLRHHPQARLVIVGDGALLWPMKVYARYCLLEYAVRFVGDVRGEALRDLVVASDVVVVPSRESTPWWPIQAGWAARKPVVATHDAAKGLTEHEKDSVLVYSSENSVVWGVERVLYDPVLSQQIGEKGRAKLEAHFGWNGLVEQVEELMTTALVS